MVSDHSESMDPREYIADHRQDGGADAIGVRAKFDRVGGLQSFHQDLVRHGQHHGEHGSDHHHLHQGEPCAARTLTTRSVTLGWWSGQRSSQLSSQRPSRRFNQRINQRFGQRFAGCWEVTHQNPPFVGSRVFSPTSRSKVDTRLPWGANVTH